MRSLCGTQTAESTCNVAFEISLDRLFNCELLLKLPVPVKTATPLPRNHRFSFVSRRRELGENGPLRDCAVPIKLQQSSKNS